MKWQPIETAPMDGRQILVYLGDEKNGYFSNERVQTAMFLPNVKSIGNHFSFDMPKPTHWMPVPDAPNPDED